MFFNLIKLILFFISYNTCVALDFPNKKDSVEVEILPTNGIFKVEEQLFIGIKFKLKNGWKTYWKNPGDAGEALTVQWQKGSKKINLPVYFPFPEKFLDKGITTIGYDGEVIFPVRIYEHQDGIKELTLNYLICKDICIPVSETKKVNINLNNFLESDEFFKNYITVPKGDNNHFQLNYNQITENKIIIDINVSENIDNLKIFGFSKETDLKINQNSESSFEVLSDEDLNMLSHPVLFSISDGKNFEEISFRPNVIKKSSNIFYYLIMAILGGFILNFMPCVFPILSLKLYSFTKIVDTPKQKISFNCLLIILGIISSFLLLAFAVIVFKMFGESLGWGFQFQNAYFITFIASLILIFSLNLLGFFEIILPETLLRKIDNFLVSKKEFNHFFSGAFATLLATPCSAPFLGTAVGFSMAASYNYVLIIFLFISIGFAFPYIIFYFFPNTIKLFPKPGKWMLVFKNILGLLLLVSAAWFFSLLQVDNKFILTIFLSILLVAFLKNRNNFNKYIFIVSSLLILTFFFNKFDQDPNISWKSFKNITLEDYLKEDKVILVDVTADWCVTCKFNKITTLNSRKVRDFLKENEVITLRADWTNKNNEIFEYIKKFDRFGIPVNVVYGPKNKNGILLPELISKDIVLKELTNVGLKND